MAAPTENENSHDERFYLSNFLETWVDILPESYFLTNINKDLERRITKTEMDIPDEMLDELEKVCSAEKLREMDDDQDEDIITEEMKEEDPSLAECLLLHVIPAQSINKLITLRTQKQYLIAQENLPHMKLTYLPQMMEFKPQFSKLKKDAGPSSDEMEYECTDTDLLITIQLFQPMLYHKGKISAFVDHEFVVRGTTLLREFRDVIQCVRDSVIAADLSNDPEPDKYLKAKEMYKSGFLYIDNVFYNDMRDSSAIDYSKKIIEWGRVSKYPELYSARALEMGDLRFMDLQLKLNEVYLYVHQGDCEHVFTFTDIRLVHEDDPPNTPGLYPMLMKSKHKKRQLCRTCGKLQAKWLVHDDPHLTDDPSYLCHLCLQLLHYDGQGQRTADGGDFRAFYFQDRATVDHGKMIGDGQ